MLYHRNTWYVFLSMPVNHAVYIVEWQVYQAAYVNVKGEMFNK